MFINTQIYTDIHQHVYDIYFISYLSTSHLYIHKLLSSDIYKKNIKLTLIDPTNAKAYVNTFIHVKTHIYTYIQLNMTTTNPPRDLSSDILKVDLTLDLIGATNAVALTIVKAIKIEENISKIKHLEIPLAISNYKLQHIRSLGYVSIL
jgi:hypothetical protein